MTTVVDLQYRPRQWQQAVHDALAKHRFVVVSAHRRAGKTLCGLMALTDAALRTVRDGALYAFIAPFRVQARQIAWQMLKDIVAPLGPLAVDISEGELQIRLKHNGARVGLFGADNDVGLRGLRLDGAVLDEFARIGGETWFSVVQPSLADRGGFAVFISTPAGLDAFYELFVAAKNRPEWAALHFTCYQTDALPKEEIERLRRDSPPNSFAREMLADFNASGDDQLISLSDVEAAAHRSYRADDYHHAARVLGVDVARFGDDRSVLFVRQGLRAFTPIVLRGASTVDVAARVAEVITQQRIDATFVDGGGVGGGVVDALRALGFNPIEVNFGAKAAKADEFVNMRTQMWCEMASWLRSGGWIPDLPELRQELATPVYSYDSQNRRALESKDQIRRRITAGSPDLADALALTFAAVVASPREIAEVDMSDFQHVVLPSDPITGIGRSVNILRRPPAADVGFGHDPFAFLNT